jgi:hypothetical protein
MTSAPSRIAPRVCSPLTIYSSVRPIIDLDDSSTIGQELISVTAHVRQPFLAQDLPIRIIVCSRSIKLAIHELHIEHSRVLAAEEVEEVGGRVEGSTCVALH